MALSITLTLCSIAVSGGRHADAHRVVSWRTDSGAGVGHALHRVENRQRPGLSHLYSAVVINHLLGKKIEPVRPLFPVISVIAIVLIIAIIVAVNHTQLFISKNPL